MASSARERIWRTAAIVMCAAVPASFYLLGDLTDAFPGVLTVRTEQEAPAAGPRAVSEDWERLEAQDLLPAPTSPAPEVDPADL